MSIEFFLIGCVCGLIMGYCIAAVTCIIKGDKKDGELH